MKLLVTGGAGYVGSVCAKVLLENGHQVVIVDDLSTGNADAVPAGAEFIDGDMIAVARTVLADGSVDGVLHFAPEAGYGTPDDLRYLVDHLHQRGIGVLITDHNVRETLGICDRAYIISEGRVLAEGRPSEIVNNAEVRKVYLGEHFRM